MNFESAQNKTREAMHGSQPTLVRSFQSQTSARSCLMCGSLNQISASRCNTCGNELTSEETAFISLKGTLLFFSVLLLISLTIAPVWSSGQIYGKAIFFLQKVGVLLPRGVSEAAKYRAMIANVINVYQTLNLLYYVTIALFAFLFIFDWYRVKQGFASFPRVVWLVLAFALLLFPLANLLISWNLFFTPGVIGSMIASFIIIFASIIDRQD